MDNYLRKLQMIEVLHTLGLLSKEQETALLNNIYDSKNKGSIQNPQGVHPNQDDAYETFFNSQSRKNLKDFFNNNFQKGGNFDKKTFANLIENLEKEAISLYQREKDFSQNLSKSNDFAKEKLTAQAQSANNMGIKSDKIFTRDEIGKMSLEEFQKNEDTIMSQYEQGLIS